MDPLEELVDAAFQDDLPRVNTLINKVADINLQDRNWSPLHAAIENENYRIVVRLIECGADLERQNNGMTALAHAVDIAVDGTRQASRPDEEVPTNIVALLIRCGALLEPALDAAQKYRCIPMIEFIQSYKKECEQAVDGNPH